MKVCNKINQVSYDLLETSNVDITNTCFKNFDNSNPKEVIENRRIKYEILENFAVVD